MKQLKDRKYYLKKIEKMIIIMNKKEELDSKHCPLLIDAKNIIIEEQKYLSDKSNKLNKNKKIYLDKMVDSIDDRIDNIKEEAINNIIENLKNYISTLNDEEILKGFGLKKPKLITEFSLEYQLKSFLTGWLYDNDSILIIKNIDNEALGFFYSIIINYNVDLIKESLIKTPWLNSFEDDIIYKVYPRNNLKISDIDKENFELIISKYKNKIKELYIIANDDLYNELEQKVLDNPELVKRENFPKLGAILKELKEKFLSQPNIDKNQRIYLKYRN